MKKLFVLLMVFAFAVVSCNNNKNGKNQNTNNRDKDDYGKNDNLNTDNNSGNKDDFNQKNGWSSSDIRSFNEQCLKTVNNNEEVAKTFCPCLLEKFQARYASLAEMDKNATEAEGKQAGEECMALVKGNTDNNTNNTASNWSKSDENQWMKACTTPLIESLGEQKANNYCSCILDRMKEIYSSYDEANTKGTEELGTELGKKCIKELGIGQQ
ncbi:MAG TPA: hypothetical protein VIV35_04795 [Chitinophagaceae bacterium]